MNKNALGVYCKKDKNFYYLETGRNHVPNTVTRLTRTLMTRNLIELTVDEQQMTSQYEVFKIKDALDKEWPMVPIFVNTHVKNARKT